MYPKRSIPFCTNTSASFIVKPVAGCALPAAQRSQSDRKHCAPRFSSAGEHLGVYLGLDIDKNARNAALTPNHPYLSSGNRYDKRTSRIIE
jgi:hypothetical protein